MSRILPGLLFLFFLSGQAQENKIHILFRFDSANLESTEREKMNQIPKESELYLRAYTDTVGSPSYNLNLSERRLKAVKKELIKMGFSIKETNFLGESDPVFDETKELAEMKSRRVIIQYKNSKKFSDSSDVPDIAEIETPKIEVQTPGQAKLQKKIDSVKVGEKIVLKNMQFYGGRHFLLPASRQSLYDLVSIMKQNPSLEIEIQGYVCCGNLGEDGYDFDLGTNNLSHTRAQSIYNYLVQEGIDKKRLSYKGYGAGHNLVKEVDDYTKSVNRRVEIKILAK
jgi:outer membrane protein OmpA-like peptidoglycan-associated protein